MQIKVTYSDDVLKALEYRRKAIKYIQNFYLSQIDVTCATSYFETERVIRNMKSDSRISTLQREIENIYACSVPKIIVIAETEHEKEILRKRLQNESD